MIFACAASRLCRSGGSSEPDPGPCHREPSAATTSHAAFTVGDGNGDGASITEIAALRSAPAHAKGSAKSTGRAVGAGLVAGAEDWRWSGLWARNHGDDAIKAILSPWPVERQVDWIDRVNAPLSAKELALLRLSVERGRHFGVEECVKRTASELGLGHTVRPEGRPPKPRNWLRPCFRPLRWTP